MSRIRNLGIVLLLSLFSASVVLGGNFVSSSNLDEDSQLSELVQSRIHAAALEGLDATWSESRPYYSSRWVRQVLQKAFPPFLWENGQGLFGPTSSQTMQLWKAQKLLKSPAEIIQLGGFRPGDVLFFRGIRNVSGSEELTSGIVTGKVGKLSISGNLSRLTDARETYPLSQIVDLQGVGRL